MKKLLTLLLILFTFFAQAQEKRKSFAINYGTGDGTASPRIFGKLDGGIGGPSEKEEWGS